jgi:methanogenic corrinoid protein MtbC1
MIELDENMFEKILTTSIINHGFEDTFVRILFPFFERIGVLWQIGTINPGQEHFMSNLIRQKMIVAIDGLVAPKNMPEQKSFVLFLPEDELHEIGLLYYSYILQKKGHKVIYLGQMMPFNDLQSIVSAQKPDALLTVFTSPVIKKDVESYIQKLASTFAHQQIFVCGRQFKLNEYNIPKKIQLIESYDQFRESI